MICDGLGSSGVKQVGQAKVFDSWSLFCVRGFNA